MSSALRRLSRLGLVCLLVSFLPPSTAVFLPAPAAAQSPPPTRSATLPLPELPAPALPLPADGPIVVPTDEPGTTAFGTLISQAASLPTSATTPDVVSTSNCSGDTAANSWAWWMRDSNNRFEYVDRSNVDFTDLVGGADIKKRLYTTDVQAGVALCLRPTQDVLTPNFTQWTVQYFRSATLNDLPIIPFATVVMTYRGTAVVNGTAYLVFSVSLNGQPAQTLTSQCTPVAPLCFILNPLSVRGLGMEAFPGAWNAQVMRTSGAPQPDLPVVMRYLGSHVHSAKNGPRIKKN